MKKLVALFVVIGAAALAMRIGASLRAPTVAAHAGEVHPTIAARAVVVAVAGTSRLELRIEIDERDAGDVRLGAPVRWHDATAHIERLAPEIARREDAVDDVATRGATRVRLAWASLEGVTALIGEHGVAEVAAPVLAAPVIVPRDAIVLRDGRAMVRVRRGPWIDDVRVKLGAYDANDVAVSGVEPGAAVVMP